MKNKRNILANFLTIALIVVMVFVVDMVSSSSVRPVFAGTQGTSGDLFFDAAGNKYYHDFYTWGDSTEVSVEIKMSLGFGKPDAIAWWAWDTDATAGDEAYADDEVFWIDKSSWAAGTIATDSRSTMNVKRKEHTTNDGAEDGVVLEFCLVRYMNP